MTHSLSLVDIHCHLLPGVDDGPSDPDESLQMARLAVQDGITTVVVTPHQLGPSRGNTADSLRRQVGTLQQLLHDHDIPLQVVPGAEIRVEPDLIEMLSRGELLTLADRSQYVLLELPRDVYFPLDRILPRLKAAGMVGILAHPERNPGILAQRDVLRPLVDSGCLLQITGSSLTGVFGEEVRKFSEWLVRQGMVHFVATDAHGPMVRRPLLRRAFDRLVELAGYETAVTLCCENPTAILDGGAVTRPYPKRRRLGPIGWFQRRRAG